MESQNTAETLKTKKRNLENLKTKYKSNQNMIRFLCICIIILSLLVFFIKNYILKKSTFEIDAPLFNCIVVFVVFYFILVIIAIKMKYNDRLIQIENDIIRVNEELELLEISEMSLEQRAEKQFKLHQNELNRYYNENIRQMRGVYNIGLFSISMGSILIILTIIISALNKNAIGNFIIPIMGIVSGILSSFIGTLFIKMYTETINTSTKFHDKLVYSNNLHFSNFLISKIKDKDKRENTICEVSKIIAESKQ